MIHITSITRRPKLDRILPKRAETTSRLVEELQIERLVLEAIMEDRKARSVPREFYYMY